MTETRSRVIGLINRPPSRRSEQAIADIIPWLSKQSQVFATASKEVMLDILKHCEYRKCQRDDLVISQGERGEEFYVMLSGRTSIFIDPTKSGEVALPNLVEEDDSRRQAAAEATGGDAGVADATRVLSGTEKVRLLLAQMDQEAKAKQQLLQRQQSSSELQADEEDKKPVEFDRKALGNFIFQLEAGKCFGEIALMTEESVRNASIIADEETDLLVVSRDLFNRAFKSQQEKEYAERHQFIDGSHLFNWWTPRFKRLLEMSLRKERFDYDSVIVQQGQQFSALQFIIRGVVSVSVDSGQHRRQYPVQFATWRPKSGLLELLVRRKRKAFEQKSLQQEAIRVKREKGYSEAERLATGRHRHLAFIEEGDCIGDFEYAMGLQSHSCTCRAMGAVETLILDLQNIERLITRRNQRSVDLMKLLVLEKSCQRLRQLGANAATTSDQTAAGTAASTAAPADATLYAMAVSRLEEETGPLMRHRHQQLRPPPSVEEREALALGRLFLADKAPLIRPCVPGSLSVKLQSHRQSQYWQRRLREKEEHSKEVQEKVARRDFHIQARSLRQLANFKRDTEPEDAVKMHRELQNSSAKKDIVNEILETTTVQNESGEKISLLVMLKMMKHLKEVRRRLSLKTTAASGDGTRQQLQQQHQGRQERWSLWGSAKPPRASSVDGKPASTAPQVRPATTAKQQRQQRQQPPGEAAFDEETSDAVLAELEDRVGDFLQRCCVVNSRPAVEEGGPAVATAAATAEAHAVTRLRRYDLDPDKVPLPGGTVLVKRKPCTAGHADRSHRHTRHYMLPSNALKILQSHSAVKMQRDSATQPPEQPRLSSSVSAGARVGSRQRPSLKGNRL